jgi:hypothetical protein
VDDSPSTTIGMADLLRLLIYAVLAVEALTGLLLRNQNHRLAGTALKEGRGRRGGDDWLTGES